MPVILKPILVVFTLLGACAPSAAAAAPPSWEPQICIGYDPEHRSWGPKGIDRDLDDDFCPSSFAFIGTTLPWGPIRPVKFLPLGGYFCRIPDGALTDEHIFVDEICPEGAVATGIRHIRISGTEPFFDSVSQTRCTMLNADHYSLGPVREGRLVDVADEYLIRLRDFFLPFISTHAAPRMSWAALPTAVRYSLGRLSLTFWNWEACLGDPIGALYTGRTAKSCLRYRFRQLYFRDAPEAPPVPVQLFPSCSAIDDIFSSNPRCVP